MRYPAPASRRSSRAQSRWRVCPAEREIHHHDARVERAFQLSCRLSSRHARPTENKALNPFPDPAHPRSHHQEVFFILVYRMSEGSWTVLTTAPLQRNFTIFPVIYRSKWVRFVFYVSPPSGFFLDPSRPTGFVPLFPSAFRRRPPPRSVEASFRFFGVIPNPC